MPGHTPVVRREVVPLSATRRGYATPNRSVCAQLPRAVILFQLEIIGRELQAERHVVLPSATKCYAEDMSNPEITQRDLRSRSREIMDAVEHGHSFTVTRDGHRIGELIPLRRRRRFVSREEFTSMSRNAPGVDLDAFRADQDLAAEHEASDPYEQ